MKQTRIQFAQRISLLKESIVYKITSLAASEKEKGRDLVSLGLGVPFYGMSKKMKQHLVEISKSISVDTYTEFPGLPKLRDLLAKEISNSTKMYVTRENILITPGGMAALMYSMMTLLSSGDEVIIYSPYFASYYQQIIMAGGKPVEVALLSKNAGYHIDMASTEKAITKKTKAILVNSPHNPTGAVFSRAELKSLLHLAIKHNVILITDEVYDYLTYDELPYTIASEKNAISHLIRCCSFSKRFGMTGWRVGYMHADSQFIEKATKIHEDISVCAPRMSQELVFFGLTTKDEELQRNKKVLFQNKDLICKRLDKLSDLFTYARPKGSFYVFPKYRIDETSVSFARRLLLEANVVTIPGTNFGNSGEGHLRFSFGTTKQQINEAFNRIDKWWEAQNSKIYD